MPKFKLDYNKILENLVMNLKEKKAIFRKKVLQNLNKKKVNWYKKDKLLINNVYNFIKKNEFKNIMIFIPLKNEANIAPLIKLLREKRYNLYVPFMEEAAFKLVKYRLPLHRKKYGIKEPGNSLFKVKQIDLAIVPILGVDKKMRRIGFGKGMYDRFFNSFKKIKFTVFLERELYYTDSIITQEHDISADSIICSSVKKIDTL